MISKSVVVLCLLGIVVGYQERGYNLYQGPPAPLNPDGTVAFTPEYQHIRNEHRAAFEREYQRIRSSINTVDPYTIPNSLKAQGNEDQGQYLPEIHEGETYDSPPAAEEEGHYHPDLYEKPYSSLYDDVQYRPDLYEQQDQQNNVLYSSPPSTQGTSYRPSPEYNAIDSSFLAYHQALSRHRRSAERYQGPPAPLNHDLTVDYTPEVKHVNAAHFSAVAGQFKRLQATAALAAAHPDRTSPPSKDYNPQSNAQHTFVPHGHLQQGQYLARGKRSYDGQYNPQQRTVHYDDGQYKHHHHKFDDGQYRPHHHYHDHGQYKPHLHQVVDYRTEPYRPAPLNPDGTVAHVPEYHAIAASHLAAHHNALTSLIH